MSDLTPVAIHRDTKAMLLDLKQHPRETWDDVIRRLVEREKAVQKGRSGAQEAETARSA